MDQGHTQSQFGATRWTLVVRARDSRPALAELLGNYRSPIYAYLRHKGYGPQDAEDLTHDFISDLMATLIRCADQQRGRFRSLLRASLDNFAADDQRRRLGRKGNRPRQFPTGDLHALEAVMKPEAEDCLSAFDRQWAITSLEAAIRAVEARCRQSGMDQQWLAFEEREVRPVQQGTAPTSYAELAQRLDVPDPQKLYTMIETVKRMVRREWEKVVEATLDDPADLPSEIADLRRALEP